MKENCLNKIFIILIVSFFSLFIFRMIFLNSFKYENECGSKYRDLKAYNYISGKIIDVQGNETMYRLGFKLDKYKNKCLVCESGDSVVYVKMRILSNRYDIKEGDSLYSYRGEGIFRVDMYRNGVERPKINLW